MTAAPALRWLCGGCGWEAVLAPPLPCRCPEARPGDDVDHVLRRRLDPALLGPVDELRSQFLDPEPNPFVRYRRLLLSHQVALAAGWSDPDFAAEVGRFDRAIAAVDGRGFRETPFAPSRALADALGLGPEGSLWVKDETGNVSGSHKARHLVGLALHLPGGEVPLAVASCGNAALAAAVVAGAAGRRLQVFVPPDAEPPVMARLADLGAELAVCPRRAGESGDPCLLRYREAIAAGALPFTCQGSENGLVLEGGMTLAWEIVSALLRAGERLDHLVVQVGGGALASACAQALGEAHALGLLPRLPRIHTVQTASAHPLARAFERVAATGLPSEEALRYAATHRSGFMWPWETAPASVARGILDDETYDWLAVVEGMLASGGRALVVDEATLVEANELALRATGIAADPTGTAGLAGALALARAGALAPGDRVAVLCTGRRRE
ncbi:MAG: pyridoxal-phosphate dependent enzyme [Thermoanaerobaculia bacterium]|nr:pyridoxal-phosphate dependent enzyme [Thermoanaerobaculia bacterium]